MAIFSAELARNTNPEVARQMLLSALSRYAGDPVTRADALPAEAVRVAQRTPRVNSRHEMVLLKQLLSLLNVLDDETCAGDMAAVNGRLTTHEYLSESLSEHLQPRTWQQQLRKATADRGSRSQLAELAVRAFEGGDLALAGQFYERLQVVLQAAANVLPQLSVNYDDDFDDADFDLSYELAMVEAATVERALLSDRPDAVREALAKPWAEASEHKRRPWTYAGTGRVRPRWPAKTELPSQLVHVLAVAPLWREGRCDEAHQSEPELLGFVVRDGRLVAVLRLGLLATLNEHLVRWFRSLMDGSATAADSELLYKQVLEPLMPFSQVGDRLNIRWEPEVPELPLAVLLHQHGPLAMRSLPVRLLPGAQELAARQESKASRRRAVVLADIDYGPASPGQAPINVLAASKEEGKLVAQRLQATLLQGRDATLAALLQQNRPSVLHLSTHGSRTTSSALPSVMLSRETPAVTAVSSVTSVNEVESATRSLLALTGARLALAHANRPAAGIERGGWVSALMLAALRLHGTQLAVLSACDSALAQNTVELAAPSLRWAMWQAGAKSIVATLWAVDDRATGVLMVHFYDGLAQGLVPSVALRRAQEMLRTDAQHPAWQSPRYWGAFTLYGTDEPVVWTNEDQMPTAGADRR